MKLILMLLIFPAALNGIYNERFADIDGNEITMSSFEGKRLLIVNAATESDSVAQFAALQTLHSLYADSLVIIVFPSNSFNNEPRDNVGIKSFLYNNYGAGYVISAKSGVAGDDIHPVFRWLTNDSLNCVLSTTIQHDFYKFLIDRNGELIGIYSNEVSPMDSSIIKAVEAP